ncbi:MAG: 2-amino-4-hydroxy-6-hydroxymethyldihydropteridine diphosphokinase [Balneolales bacterium]|nr:2-amino-4-hydroxy-6-hydroxymethyldihydropteridine diphosphokinase [Balneolales bacterium]
MATVILAIGSNQGDRLNNLIDARRFIKRVLISHKDNTTGLSHSFNSSSIWESEPIGPAENIFLNACVICECNLSPEDILTEIKLYEKSCGRLLHAPRWSNRPIDIDIISYDGLIIDTDQLIVPHKEITNRLFVLLPLLEIYPAWQHPVHKKTVSQLIDEAPHLDVYKSAFNW